MAKLTVESGKILTDKDQINALIAPNIYGFVSFSQYLDNLISKPMNEINQKIYIKTCQLKQ
ncbi:hypothetical protein L3V83_02615 [Thiotrichales bacterium 19X7-9]|nr:hypothetical protein [Thiotrichales bacterium 19X7-9]